ncbi:hypothetical protein ACROYT_G015444 [Oculina patagonica]
MTEKRDDREQQEQNISKEGKGGNITSSRHGDILFSDQDDVDNFVDNYPHTGNKTLDRKTHPVKTRTIEVKALVIQSRILLVLHLCQEKKVSITLSSPVSKKKLPFRRDFTASHSAQEKEKKCSTPFERYMKKAECDIERKKSKLHKLRMEEKEISLKILKVQSGPSDGNMWKMSPSTWAYAPQL